MHSAIQGNGIYLAFDASCGTCKGISRRVQSAAKGRIIAVPLSDPDVQAARDKIYNGDAPHKPTLLRVRDGDVQAWTGPSMGLILTKEIGASDTLAIVQALGIERQSGHRTFVRPAVEKKFSRRRFGQVAAGLAAGISIFSTGSLTSAAFAEGNAPDEGQSLDLSDDEAQSLFDAAVSSVDLRNIAPEGAIDRLSGGQVLTLDQLPAPSRYVRLSTEGSTDLGDGVVAPGDGVLAVITSKSFGDGTTSQTVAIALTSSQLLTHIAEQVGDQSGEGAEYYKMDAASGELEIVEVGAGGVVSEPVPDGAITTMASDPCGGCAKVNSILSSTCKSTRPVSCVLQGVGCYGCTAVCASGIGKACITCVVGACGLALKTCCNDGSTAVCKPCKILP